ncbi:hypothetical protein V461_10275 [Pantoea ananatis BRT98]|nr:hypothetical protein V461_10275 [Pantoea ananatis BRT98]
MTCRYVFCVAFDEEDYATKNQTTDKQARYNYNYDIKNQ